MEITFEHACTIVGAALQGSARHELIAEYTKAKDLGTGLLKLRDAMRANTFKAGAHQVFLDRMIRAFDGRTRAEGFHILHDWDGAAQQVNPDVIAVDVLHFLVNQRGTDEAGTIEAAILLDYYFMHVLALLSMRVWDEGDANANLDRLNVLLAELQGPGGSGQLFADDAETLMLIGTSHYEPHEWGYGKLLERLKVDAHIFRVGTFKSAVEPYIRTDMSPESREASTAIYSALWEAWKADVTKARPKVNLALATGDPAAWLRASGGEASRAALAAGLVDRIGDEVAFGNRVAELVGADSRSKLPGTFAHTGLKNWLAANQPEQPGRPIGVITIAGEIVDGEAGPGTAGGERIAKLLDEAQDKKLAALVVRVDSPGGSVFASEQIRNAINRYKVKSVPIVVSMANLAASGGYWVSTPASRVFADPSTITGSIGVYAVIPSFERALSEWGVTSDGIKTTPLSGQPDVVGGLTPGIEGMLQANTESIYAKFLGLVSRARGKSPAEVDAMAQGRVWDGGTARQKGLVDQFGGLEEALADAARLAKLEPGEWHPLYLGADADPYASLFERLTQDEEGASPGAARDWAGLIAARQGALVTEALAGAERLVGRPGAQAYCLECPPAPMLPRLQAGSLSLLARLERLIAHF